MSRKHQVLVLCFTMIGISAVSAPLVFPASAQEVPSPQIMPGLGIGPVRLGMVAGDATRVAARFAVATDGCTIDVLVERSHVVAAGTRWAGCIELAVPRAAQPVGVLMSGKAFPVWPAIGSAPYPFVTVFGQPTIVHLDDDSAALIWRNGLVALVEGVREGDGVVTYLAVTAPGSKTAISIIVSRLRGGST